MKTLIYLLFSLSLLLFPELLKSQSWAKHGVGFAGAGVCVIDISAPSDNVAWGILSVFSAGTCGGQVPYFTRTTNGFSWSGGLISLPADVTPVCISAISTSTAWIAASNIASNTTGYIYKTTSGGTTWTLQGTAVFPDAIRFIHFFNANEGVATGDSSVFITTNGGTTWIANGALPVPIATVGSGTTNFLLNAYEVLGNNIWLGDSFGNFYKSMDRGLTWVLCTNPITPSAVKGIAFRDSLYGIAVAAQWNGGGGNGGGFYADFSVITTDGGNTWAPLNFQINSNTVVYSSAKYDIAYVPGTSNTFIITSEYDSSYAAFSAISTDGGVSWNLLDSTEQHTVCVFTSANKGYTGGYITSQTEGIFKWVGNISTSIPEQSNSIEISIAPNPVRDVFRITTKEKILSYLITDYTGRIILSEKENPATDNSFTIDVSSLPAGLYLLKYSTDNKSYQVAKFVH